MRKKQPWYSFRLIVPALILLPPLGLVLLWKSPRTPRVKLMTSVLLLVFAAGAFAGAVKSGVYARYIESRQPRADVYDVRMDSRNRYISQEVLPFERKIFAAVIRSARTMEIPNTQSGVGSDIVDYDSIDPKRKAYEAVGETYGLDYEDVQSIYRKVAILMQKQMKK